LPLTRRLWLHSLHVLGRSAFAAEMFLGTDSKDFVAGTFALLNA
jgi:hypothetical protein